MTNEADFINSIILAKFNNKLFFTNIDFSSGYLVFSLMVALNQFCVVPNSLNISNAAFDKGLEAVLIILQ